MTMPPLLQGVDQPLWPNSSHYNCVFHLSQNFFDHVKPPFGADFDGYKSAINCFWVIAKQTDSRSRDTFNSDWNRLEGCLYKVEDSPGRQRALEWLQGLKHKAHKWCLRFVWSKCTWGVHSTQRAESTQAQVKASLLRNLQVKQLLPQLDSVNEVSRSNAAVREAVARLKQQRQRANCALVEFLEPLLSPFAMKLLFEQQLLAVNYDVNSLEESTDEDDPLHDSIGLHSRNALFDGENWAVRRRGTTAPLNLVLTADGEIDWENTVGTEDFGRSEVSAPHRITSLLHCSCQFDIAFGGIVCRHVIQCHSVKQSSLADHKAVLNNIKTKWLQVDSTTSDRMIAKQRSAPDPTIAPIRIRASGGTLSRAERSQLLKQEFNVLSDLALASNHHFDAIIEALKKTKLDILNPSQTSTAPRERPRFGGNVTSDAQATTTPATTTEPTEPAPVAPTSASATDEADLNKLLGGLRQTLSLAPTEDDLVDDGWWVKLVDREIAIKTKQKRAGGWCMGIIVSACGGDDTVTNTEHNYHLAAEDGDGADEEGGEDEGEGEGGDDGGEVEGDDVNLADSSDEAEAETGGYSSVEAVVLEAGQVKVIFPAEGNAWDIYHLQLKTYTSSAYASKGSWMLLEDRPLGVGDGEQVRQPRAHRKVGRPRGRRFTKAAGPLGRPIRKGKKNTRKK